MKHLNRPNSLCRSLNLSRSLSLSRSLNLCLNLSRSLNLRLNLSLHFLLPCLFLLACTPTGPGSYASTQQIAKEGWPKQYALICEVQIEDTISLFHIDITGRIRNTYLLDSLSLIVEVTSPLGCSFCDTLSFGLTNTRNRLWEEFRFPYCSDVCFSETGRWQFTFRHNMEDEVIEGVMSAGVYIRRLR